MVWREMRFASAAWAATIFWAIDRKTGSLAAGANCSIIPCALAESKLVKATFGDDQGTDGLVMELLLHASAQKPTCRDHEQRKSDATTGNRTLA